MVDLNEIPRAISLDLPPLAPIRALLREMQDCAQESGYTSSSAPLSTVHLQRLFPDAPSLLVVLADVPACLDSKVSDWLCEPPFPNWYQGEMQEPFTGLQFESVDGATLCIDVERIGSALTENITSSTKLLVCIATGRTLHLKLLDNALLTEPQFAANLKKCFRDGAESRSNHYNNIRKDRYMDKVEPIELTQSYEGIACVVTLPLAFD
jgi:hypothetical protein